MSANRRTTKKSEKLPKLLNSESINSLTKTAKVSLAKGLKAIRDESAQKKEGGYGRYIKGASQTIVPARRIRNGLIVTSDGRYVGIIEILPINFAKKTKEEKTAVLGDFGNVFKKPRDKFGLKITSDIMDPATYFLYLKQNCRNQDNPKIRATLNKHIQFVKALSKGSSVVKRYFFTYEYEGASAQDEKTIFKEMDQTRKEIIQALSECGNACIDPPDKDKAAMEYLYKHFNKKTSHYETLDERIERINADYEAFNAKADKKKQPHLSDYVASKGVYLINRNYVYMDGMYYTYLGIKGNVWPMHVYGGWLDVFDYGLCADIDINFKRLPDYSTKMFLKLSNNSGTGKYNKLVRANRNEKAESKLRSLRNNTSIYNQMKAGANLYDASIIITLSSESSDRLDEIKHMVMNHIRTKLNLDCEDSYLYCEEYMLMTTGLLYYTSIFNNLKHNILSSDIQSIYPFTAYQLYDPRGTVVGLVKDSSTIAALNNFDSMKYMNANMAILGTSGSGKSTTLQTLGGRMLLNGMRCFYIIPKKGYEYLNGCMNVDGQYIRLVPGSSQCINIMEIRPEGKIDESVLGESVAKQTGSWLTKKIINLCAWINLLMVRRGRKMTLTEYSNAKLILKEVVYAEYGITDDNASIFADIKTQTLKIMPIIEDMYNAFVKAGMEDVALVLKDFVTGTCSNLNGQTNVNLDNNYIVFDVDEDDIGEELLPAFMYIPFDFAYSVIKEQPLSKDVVFLDEAWKFMQVEEAAKQVENMVRLIRGYGGSTVIATQEINVFLNQSFGHGETILNNSFIKLLLFMEENDLKKVVQVLPIDKDDEKKIQKLKKGEAFLLTKDDKIEIKIMLSKQEKKAYNTDVNIRLKEQMKKEGKLF